MMNVRILFFLIGFILFSGLTYAASELESSPSTFLLSEKIPASDPETNSEFGYALAMSRDAQVLVVGARLKDVNGNSNQGQVYVFRRNGNTWQETQILTASDGAANDEFGSAVAISDAPAYTIVIGAPKDDTGASTDLGAAYVFTYNGSIWSEHAKLNATDPNQFSYNARGTSVAMSSHGDTAFVGTPGVVATGAYKGAVYVFQRNGNVWEQTQVIGGPVVDAAGLGSAMLLSGDAQTLFVKGAYSPGGPLITYYLVRVYQRQGGNWTEVDTLIPSDSQEFDDFGDGMAATEDGSVLLIGAPDNNNDNGKVFFYTETGGDWAEQTAFSRPAGSPYQYFGESIALDATGTKAVIGAWLGGSGGLHRYERTGNTWVHLQTLKTPDIREEHLGFSLAMSADASMLISGARWAHPTLQTYAPIGALYVFRPGYQIFAPLVVK